MDFSSILHPVNFKFPGQGKFPFKAALRDYGNGVWRLRINYNDDAGMPDESDLNPGFTASGEDAAAGEVSFEKGSLRIFSPAGTLLLESAREGFFGTEGDSWVMRFEQNAGDRFYGLGEKSGAFEKSGKRTLMWNVDAWGAHGMDACRSGAPDPLYANIPYLLLRRKDEALGILVNDPAEVFFSLNPDLRLHPSQDPVRGSSFYFGAAGGAPDIYFITGRDTASVIRKSGLLSGTFPRPPLWSLGYHQCRWGYSGTRDLEELDRRMTAAKIPCDGLWLDIDYMDKYKVFTTSPKTFADAARERVLLDSERRRSPRIRLARRDALPGFQPREDETLVGVPCTQLYRQRILRLLARYERSFHGIRVAGRHALRTRETSSRSISQSVCDRHGEGNARRAPRKQTRGASLFAFEERGRGLGQSRGPVARG